jgi:hypothetical protein
MLHKPESSSKADSKYYRLRQFVLVILVIVVDKSAQYRILAEERTTGRGIDGPLTTEEN